ncbi:MAG: 3'(2'),5'-bisphosphate nucleotidase CysQ [Pseudomonadota bacterium]
MPVHDLALLCDAAQMAGRVATSFVGKTARRWEKPGDAGPVTEADLAVNDMLHSTLQLARPDYGWLSEETEDNADRLRKRDVFIIDPIDGTRSFVEGSNTWAHSLAVARDGIITAAVVYLPMRGKLYAAGLGMGATLNGAPLHVSGTANLGQATVLAARPALAAHHWKPTQAPAFKRSYRPSLAYRLALVGEGRYDGMITLRKTWEWDIAAGALIVSEAGGRACDRTGGPLIFNSADPRLNGIVAANVPSCSAIVDALA